jgi:ABC-type nitrate/sulfonate/bicarbonate transport system substrate-binding protein
MLAKLEAGDLDLVSILTEGMVAAIDKGLPVTVLQVYVASPLQWGAFVPADSRFEKLDQLDGARIAISRFNSGSHLMAFIVAEEQGWSLSDDQFVVVGGIDGAVESFADGHSDLFLWERHMTQPLVDAGRFRSVGVMETPWPSFVIAARTEVLSARTTEVGRVVDAVVAQANGLHSRPGVTELIADRYRLESHTVGSWLNSTEYAKRSAIDPSIGQRVLDTLADAGFE